jgi:hypothetical protein
LLSSSGGGEGALYFFCKINNFYKKISLNIHEKFIEFYRYCPFFLKKEGAYYLAHVGWSVDDVLSA